MFDLTTIRDLVLALRWSLHEGVYTQRTSRHQGWQVIANKDGQTILARADTRAQAWELLANLSEAFYAIGP
jgi:hypothetical protein